MALEWGGYVGANARPKKQPYASLVLGSAPPKGKRLAFGVDALDDAIDAEAQPSKKAKERKRKKERKREEELKKKRPADDRKPPAGDRKPPKRQPGPGDTLPGLNQVVGLHQLGLDGGDNCLELAELRIISSSSSVEIVKEATSTTTATNRPIQVGEPRRMRPATDHHGYPISGRRVPPGAFRITLDIRFLHLDIHFLFWISVSGFGGPVGY